MYLISRSYVFSATSQPHHTQPHLPEAQNSWWYSITAVVQSRRLSQEWDIFTAIYTKQGLQAGQHICSFCSQTRKLVLVDSVLVSAWYVGSPHKTMKQLNSSLQSSLPLSLSRRAANAQVQLAATLTLNGQTRGTGLCDSVLLNASQNKHSMTYTVKPSGKMYTRSKLKCYMYFTSDIPIMHDYNACINTYVYTSRASQPLIKCLSTVPGTQSHLKLQKPLWSGRDGVSAAELSDAWICPNTHTLVNEQEYITHELLVCTS